MERKRDGGSRDELGTEFLENETWHVSQAKMIGRQRRRSEFGDR